MDLLEAGDAHADEGIAGGGIESSQCVERIGVGGYVHDQMSRSGFTVGIGRRSETGR